MKPRFLLTFTLIILLGILKTSAQADTVKTGAYIISVHDINFHEKQYTIRFWLWFLLGAFQIDAARQRL